MISYVIIPDILGICETTINKKTKQLLTLTCYNFKLQLNSILNSGGVKDSIIYSIRQN